MMRSVSYVLFLVFLPGGARRTIRISGSRHGALQRNNTLATGLEVSAEARAVFAPAGFGMGGHRAAPMSRQIPRHAEAALQAVDPFPSKINYVRAKVQMSDSEKGGGKVAARCSSKVGTPRLPAGDVGVILLSAGMGKRMGVNFPKQYMKLSGREIALRSLDVFLDCDDVAEIVIVCADDYRTIFEEHLAGCSNVRPVIKYASGGKERQDSVYSGLACITSEFVAVHDSARPLVTKAEVERVISDARAVGAAVLAVPTKATIKQAVVGGERDGMVATTPNRKTLWEAHTPQVVRTSLLRRGFSFAMERGLDVTDDVSVVELLGEPVRITEGQYTNIKVTTPEDIEIAESILSHREP